MNMTEKTKTTIAGVDGRYFIVRADGEIDDRNAFGKFRRFAFTQLASARAHARRRHANVFDKAAGCCVESFITRW